MTEDGSQLSETDLALIDALSLVFDLLLQGRDDVARQLAELLDVHIRNWEQQRKPRTAAILAMIKLRSTNPDILEGRRRALALKDPKGSAD